MTVVDSVSFLIPPPIRIHLTKGNVLYFQAVILNRRQFCSNLTMRSLLGLCCRMSLLWSFEYLMCHSGPVTLAVKVLLSSIKRSHSFLLSPPSAFFFGWDWFLGHSQDNRGGTNEMSLRMTTFNFGHEVKSGSGREGKRCWGVATAPICEVLLLMPAHFQRTDSHCSYLAPRIWPPPATGEGKGSFFTLNQVCLMQVEGNIDPAKSRQL